MHLKKVSNFVQTSVSSQSNQSGRFVLTLDAETLLVLDDEILLVVLQLAQVVLGVLGQQSQLLKSLIDLLVFLRHAVHHATHRRARLPITKPDLETEEWRDGQLDVEIN